MGAFVAEAAGAGPGMTGPLRAAPLEGLWAGLTSVCGMFPLAATGAAPGARTGARAGALAGATAGGLAAAAPVTLLAAGAGTGVPALLGVVGGAGAGALAEDVGTAALAPPRAWPAAVAGVGGPPQTGSSGCGTGCPVAGLTTCGHWQLKSSREQPKSCALTHQPIRAVVLLRKAYMKLTSYIRVSITVQCRVEWPKRETWVK